MSSSSFPWSRPATVLAWQTELARLTRNQRHLHQSTQWAQGGGLLLCLANAFPLAWWVHVALSVFLAALFLYALGVGQLLKRLEARRETLEVMDPPPSQLTRWQGSPDAVRYRQQCLASGLPVLVGDASWMDHLTRSPSP